MPRHLLLPLMLSALHPAALAGTPSAAPTGPASPATAQPPAETLRAINQAGLQPALVLPLLAKPLYQFSESEVDTYLRYLQAAVPDLRERIVHLARKNIGQPYELYLLGELPFETYDPQPIYCLTRSDCLVFAEHTYAMALSGSWTTFIRLLQRIRYHEGRIGVATRNHFTEADWNPANAWLVRDITAEVAGPKAAVFDEKIDRAKFLLGRYGLKTSIAVEEHHDTYVPYTEVACAFPALRDGDMVDVVRGIVKPGTPENEIFGGHAWIGHVGLIAHGPDGTVHLIHSSEPAVREEPLAEFIARSNAHAAAAEAAGKQRLLGFKFLRLEPAPLENLRKIDGDQMPRVSLPDGRAAGL